MDSGTERAPGRRQCLWLPHNGGMCTEGSLPEMPEPPGLHDLIAWLGSVDDDAMQSLAEQTYQKSDTHPEFRRQAVLLASEKAT